MPRRRRQRARRNAPSMNSARFLVAVLILAGAALAACSGNFGSGTTPPNGLLAVGQFGRHQSDADARRRTPRATSSTYGSLDAFQPLPNVAGYGGAIAFPVPSPKPSGFADVAVGATLSIVSPERRARSQPRDAKGKKGKKRERPARALVYLTLLPTHDMTLESYPRIAIDVPRDIVDDLSRERIRTRDLQRGHQRHDVPLGRRRTRHARRPPPTPTPNPSAPPPPDRDSGQRSPTPSPSPGASAHRVRRQPPLPSGVTAGPATSGSAASVASPTLPPQRITFAGTAAPLKLTANRAGRLRALRLAAWRRRRPRPHAGHAVARSSHSDASTGSESRRRRQRFAELPASALARHRGKASAPGLESGCAATVRAATPGDRSGDGLVAARSALRRRFAAGSAEVHRRVAQPLRVRRRCDVRPARRHERLRDAAR